MLPETGTGDKLIASRKFSVQQRDELELIAKENRPAEISFSPVNLLSPACEE